MADVQENDWEGRYDHIDQILDAPGPRTDEGFMAGDGVRVLPLLTRRC